MSLIRELASEGVRALSARLQYLADELGLSTAALRRYRLKDRTPDQVTLKRLVVLLRSRAQHMDRIAGQLEAAIERGDKNAQTTQ